MCPSVHQEWHQVCLQGWLQAWGLAQSQRPGNRSCCLALPWGLVLWRSPAPDCLLEAHVPMFTRKHSIPLRMDAPERVCCPGFPALPVTPASVGVPGARWPAPIHPEGEEFAPCVGMATTLSPTSRKNLICQFPATVGP